MLTVTARHDETLSRNEIVAVVMLLNNIWPGQDQISQLVDLDAGKRHQVCPESSQRSIRYLIWDQQQLVAHALTFERVIIASTRRIPVMALAGVCVLSSHREHGLGTEVVRHAFKRVDNGDFPVALFQTAVPTFYERLRATRIQNRFINSKNIAAPDRTPWHDPSVMVYPVESVWPDGVIDLNGQGY